MIRARGFTIVELLIVVVVIAILAAITIVSYNGITNLASDSAVKSSIAQIHKKIQLASVESDGRDIESIDMHELLKGVSASGLDTSLEFPLYVSSPYYNRWDGDEPFVQFRVMGKSKSGKTFSAWSEAGKGNITVRMLIDEELQGEIDDVLSDISRLDESLVEIDTYDCANDRYNFGGGVYEECVIQLGLEREWVYGELTYSKEYLSDLEASASSGGFEYPLGKS